jgi:hypothetical protein
MGRAVRERIAPSAREGLDGGSQSLKSISAN